MTLKEGFWKAALGVGGVATVGAAVFYGLYSDVLHLGIFSKLSPDQTFAFLKLFLWLVLAALVVMVVVWVLDKIDARRNRPTPLTDSPAWLHLLATYQTLCAVNPKKPNREDLARAIDALNEAGTLFRERPDILEPFRNLRGNDFKVLYETLTQNKIPVPQMNATSDKLISDAAHALARALNP